MPPLDPLARPIRQRRDGVWYLAFTDRGHRYWLYGADEAAVRRKLRLALREMDAGRRAVPKQETLDVFLRRWLDGRAPSLRPRVEQGYRILVFRHVLPELGGVRLSDLRGDRLEQFYASKLKTLSAGTVRNIHGLLRAALGDALRWELAPRNAALQATPPRIPRNSRRALRPDEARRLLEAARGDRLEALYVLALTTGMRRGELLGLRWRDVDLEAGRLAVVGNLQRTA